MMLMVYSDCKSLLFQKSFSYNYSSLGYIRKQKNILIIRIAMTKTFLNGMSKFDKLATFSISNKSVFQTKTCLCLLLFWQCLHSNSHRVHSPRLPLPTKFIQLLLYLRFTEIAGCSCCFCVSYFLKQLG